MAELIAFPYCVARKKNQYPPTHGEIMAALKNLVDVAERSPYENAKDGYQLLFQRIKKAKEVIEKVEKTKNGNDTRAN